MKNKKFLASLAFALSFSFLGSYLSPANFPTKQIFQAAVESGDDTLARVLLGELVFFDDIVSDASLSVNRKLSAKEIKYLRQETKRVQNIIVLQKWLGDILDEDEDQEEEIELKDQSSEFKELKKRSAGDVEEIQKDVEKYNLFKKLAKEYLADIEKGIDASDLIDLFGDGRTVFHFLIPSFLDDRFVDNYIKILDSLVIKLQEAGYNVKEVINKKAKIQERVDGKTYENVTPLMLAVYSEASPKFIDKLKEYGATEEGLDDSELLKDKNSFWREKLAN